MNYKNPFPNGKQGLDDEGTQHIHPKVPEKTSVFLHTLHMSGVGKRSFRDMLQGSLRAKLKHTGGRKSGYPGNHAAIECASDEDLYTFLKVVDKKTFPDKHAACDFGKVLVTHGSPEKKMAVYPTLQGWKKAYSQRDQALQEILFALSLSVRDVMYVKKKEEDDTEKTV